MTMTEAIEVGEVISHADDGCFYCVTDLCERLNKKSLGFVWTVRDDRSVDVRESVKKIDQSGASSSGEHRV